jgi:hypothetical protein
MPLALRWPAAPGQPQQPPPKPCCADLAPGRQQPPAGQPGSGSRSRAPTRLPQPGLVRPAPHQPPPPRPPCSAAVNSQRRISQANPIEAALRSNSSRSIKPFNQTPPPPEVEASRPSGAWARCRPLACCHPWHGRQQPWPSCSSAAHLVDRRQPPLLSTDPRLSPTAGAGFYNSQRQDRYNGSSGGQGSKAARHTAPGSTSAPQSGPPKIQPVVFHQPAQQGPKRIPSFYDKL